jgi:hypothetical protein
VTPRYLSLSITDPVTLHCITLTLLGSTIKLQEPSQETRNWGLPSRNNPPLARNTQPTNTKNNNYYKTETSTRCQKTPRYLLWRNGTCILTCYHPHWWWRLAQCRDGSR